jgi:hypothetical protein
MTDEEKRDPGTISTDDQYVVAYVAKKFGLTVSEVRSIVDEIGPDAVERVAQKPPRH